MIKINGKEYDCTGISLTEYLLENGYNLKYVAVEKNSEIVPKVKYDETVLNDGDSIEIVSFVGGG